MRLSMLFVGLGCGGAPFFSPAPGLELDAAEEPSSLPSSDASLLAAQDASSPLPPAQEGSADDAPEDEGVSCDACAYWALCSLDQDAELLYAGCNRGGRCLGAMLSLRDAGCD